MFRWMIISISVVVLEAVELFLNFSIPFIELRIVLFFLLVLGMAYHLYLIERTSEKELLNE